MKKIAILFLFFFTTVLFAISAETDQHGYPPKSSAWYKLDRHYTKLIYADRFPELVELYQQGLEKAEKDGQLIRQIVYALRIMEVYTQNLPDYSKAVEYGKKALELIYQGEVVGSANEPEESFFPWSFGRRSKDWSKDTWYQARKESVISSLYFGALYDQGKYDELVEVYAWELKLAKKYKNRARQIEIGIRAARSCQDNLEDFARAIKFGEMAHKAINEGIAAGPQNDPDTWFYPEIRMIKRITGEDRLAERIRDRKIAWYKEQKQQAGYILGQSHRLVGNNKKAEFYDRKSQDSSPSELEIYKKLKIDYGEMLVKADQNIKEEEKRIADYAKQHGQEAIQGWSTEGIESWKAGIEKTLRETEEKIAELESGKENIYQRMYRLQAEGDSEGLRTALGDYESELYNGSQYDKERQLSYGRNYINFMIYPQLAQQAYFLEFYQETYDYAIKAIEAHKKFLPQYKQYLIDEGKKVCQERVDYYEKEKAKRAAEMGEKFASQSYDSIIEGEKWKGLTESDKIMLESRRLMLDYQDVWLWAGKALRKLRRYQETVKFLDKAYKYKVETSPHISRGVMLSQEGLPKHIEALQELSYTYREAGMNRKSIEAFSALLDYLDGIRAKLTLSAQKVGYLGRHTELYDKIISILIEEARGDDALGFVERARSRAFVDLLGDKRLKPKTKKAQQLIARRDSIESEYLKLLSEPATKTGPAERSIQIVQKQMDDVIEKIKQEDAEFISATTVETLKADQIQKLLDSNTVILEYYLMRDAIFIWIVTKDSLKVEKVNAPIWIVAQKVAQLREEITNPRRSSIGVKSVHQPPQVRLEILPKKFKKGDEYTWRVYVKNNSSLFLAIDWIKSKVGDSSYQDQKILEKEIPPKEEKIVCEQKIEWIIIPGMHEAVFQTDQGEFISNSVEVVIDKAGMVTVTDKGGGRGTNIQADIEKYASLNLYDLLIKPVKSYLNKERVIIIPHGVLHYLPFAALENNGRYLIEDYALTYLPSATVYKFCKDKAKKLGGKLLAFGNPDLGDPQLDIPFALTEAKAIGKLYSASKVLSRDAASEAAFKSFSPAYDILHLASHGVFNADNPMDSALLLSSGGKEDGRLTMSEIFDLDINAGLVTLGACSSGMSRIKSGDELMGFPRAFIYAGVPSIVATLWNVNDEATAVLMTFFYKNLKIQDKAQALRTAQIDLLKKTNYKKPYYWAPFYLIGDYQNDLPD